MSNNQLSIINRKGTALLIVLVIVMAVTILSLGYAARSDIELACGRNMILRTQMDCLAESGLVHARGLILNPQDVDTGSEEYWTGEVQQWLYGENDFYDVGVVQLGQCDYEITSAGYRQKSGQEVGRSSIKAQLRLDPCIAYWAGATTTIPAAVTINGDVYCAGDLTNSGTVNGDAFAAGTITGGFLGSKSEYVSAAPVDWPQVTVNSFSSQYYIGHTLYSVQVVIDPNVSDTSFPAAVWYCSGNMELAGNVAVNGTLVVDGNLTVSAGNNTITAVKNFPALLVNGELLITDGGQLQIDGLAVISQGVSIDPNAVNFALTVVGGLFIQAGGIDVESGSPGSIDITAAPAKAALQTWPSPGSADRWTQAADAFFKSIEKI